MQNKTKRLSKLARELNVGVKSLVSYANKLGYHIDPNPNTKVDQNLCAEIIKKIDSKDKVHDLDEEKIEIIIQHSSKEDYTSGISKETYFKYCATYTDIIVESFISNQLSNTKGEIRIRPLKEQSPFSPNLYVSCSSQLSEYPVGTKFMIRAKLCRRKLGGYYIYSHYSWRFHVISESE